MYKRGDKLETIIENVAHMYRHQKKAMLFKRPVDKAVVGGKVKYLAKAGVDFNGMLCGSGRFIAFEAKEITTKTTKNFNLKLLHQHQYEELKYIHDQGGIAFLLLHFNDGVRNDFFRVPVGYLEEQLIGFKARQIRNNTRKTVQTVVECEGVLNYSDMVERGYTVAKNANNVYVDILGGIGE